MEEYKQKRFANTKPRVQQQSILLPSPLGEGLGVRPVEGSELAVNRWGEASCRPIAGSCAAFFMEGNEQKRFASTKPTALQQGILLPSPLGEGLGVRPVAGSCAAVFY